MYAWSGPLHSRVFTKLLQPVAKSNGKQMSQRPYDFEETTDFSITKRAYVLNNHKARRFKNTFLTINYSDVAYSKVL